jgi:hypothetical protein
VPIDQFFAEAEETRERKLGPIGGTPLADLRKNPDKADYRRRLRARHKKGEAMSESVICGAEGCNAIFDIPADHVGRRPKYCDEHRGGRTVVKTVEIEDGNTEGGNPPSLQEDYDDILDELRDIMARKNHDYSASGGDNISALGVKGVFVRMWDKIHRLRNIVWEDRDAQVLNETLDDTLVDIANYAIIALLVRRGKWGKMW